MQKHFLDSSSSSYSDVGSKDSIEEEVDEAIKNIPDLSIKLRAIAINSYIQEKRKADEKSELQIQKIQLDYRNQYQKQIEEINNIIEGKYEFTDIDLMEMQPFLNEEEKSCYKGQVPSGKLQNYWYKVLMNCKTIQSEIQQYDKPILKHLQKIQGKKSENLKVLTLVFYFSQNDWFENEKIAKQFHVSVKQIQISTGDKIIWKEGKNVTIKKEKRKKKNKKFNGQKRRPSFFNIFREIDNKNGSMQVNEDDLDDAEWQHGIAEEIYEEIIPFSLQYYLNLDKLEGKNQSEDFSEEDQNDD